MARPDTPKPVKTPTDPVAALAQMTRSDEIEQAIRVLESHAYALTQSADANARVHVFWCLASLERAFKNLSDTADEE